MIVPSKELLSAVLVLPIVYVQDYIEVDEVIYETEMIAGSINIYELQHKMKTWADTKNIAIQSYIWFGRGISRVSSMDDNVELYFEESANTEFEAVTQACEWILKDINESSKRK